jgi:hypothetical protein
MNTCSKGLTETIEQTFLVERDFIAQRKKRRVQHRHAISNLGHVLAFGRQWQITLDTIFEFEGIVVTEFGRKITIVVGHVPNKISLIKMPAPPQVHGPDAKTKCENDKQTRRFGKGGAICFKGQSG